MRLGSGDKFWADISEGLEFVDLFHVGLTAYPLPSSATPQARLAALPSPQGGG
jgi:hypothetical protein